MQLYLRLKVLVSVVLTSRACFIVVISIIITSVLILERLGIYAALRGVM